MADADMWLERWCKDLEIDYMKIPEEEWDKLINGLENMMDDWLDNGEAEIKESFVENFHLMSYDPPKEKQKWTQIKE